MSTQTATRKTPTLSEFKKFSKDIAPAARAVLMARVHAQMERERVDAYILPIFRSFPFVYGSIVRGCQDRVEGQPVQSPHDLYLVEDEPMLADYYAECDKAHRAHGFKGPNGHCPALVAENLVMTTERLLIELALPLFGIEHVYGEDRVKYLELLIGAAMKADQEAR